MKTERSHEARREFLQFGGLRHRNVVEYLRFFYDNHRPIIATRFIDGKNLHVLAADAQASGENTSPEWLRRVLRWGYELSDALCYLDRCPVPVVHRDIKPSNVMIQEEDDMSILIDFGIGKLNVESRPRSMSTLGQGSFLGTLEFAAPEQFVVDSKATGKADVYSLALTIASALNPASVPEGDESRPQAYRSATQPRFELLPQIPALQDLLKSMTAQNSHDRPGAHVVRETFGRIMRQFGDAPPAGDTGAMPPPPPANYLTEFVSIGHGIEMARTLLSRHTALYYSDRHHDSLELDASSRIARRSFVGALELIEIINREMTNCGHVYRMPTLDEWRQAAGIPQAGLLSASEVECIFDNDSSDMEWLDKGLPCLYPECRRVAYLLNGEPQDTERHQSWPKGAIRLVRESNISS
jgi:serine/threonine protein kinase